MSRLPIIVIILSSPFPFFQPNLLLSRNSYIVGWLWIKGWLYASFVFNENEFISFFFNVLLLCIYGLGFSKSSLGWLFLPSWTLSLLLSLLGSLQLNLLGLLLLLSQFGWYGGWEIIPYFNRISTSTPWMIWRMRNYIIFQ